MQQVACCRASTPCSITDAILVLWLVARMYLHHYYICPNKANPWSRCRNASRPFPIIAIRVYTIVAVTCMFRSSTKTVAIDAIDLSIRRVDEDSIEHIEWCMYTHRNMTLARLTRTHALRAKCRFPNLQVEIHQIAYEMQRLTTVDSHARITVNSADCPLVDRVSTMQHAVPEHRCTLYQWLFHESDAQKFCTSFTI